MYERVLAWIRFDPSVRRQYVAKVMANIRFPLMPLNYLTTHVETETLLQDNSHCKDYISEALRYHESKSEQASDTGVDSSRFRPRLNPRCKMVIMELGNKHLRLCDLSDGRWHQGTITPTIRHIEYVFSLLDMQ